VHAARRRPHDCSRPRLERRCGCTRMLLCSPRSMHLPRTALTVALAVIAGSAAAGFLLARRLEGDHHDSDHEEEEEDEMPEAMSKSLLRRNSALSTLTKSGSNQKLQRLESAIFSKYHGDDDAQTRLAACLNDELSPADNAAALLHLMIADHPELSGPSRAALVYSIKALKSEDNTSTLPSALLDDPSGRSSPSGSGSFKSGRMAQSFKAISQGIVAVSRFKRKASKSTTQLGGLAAGVQCDQRRQNEKELVYSWLRTEYSNYRRSTASVMSGACCI
jgi:hypothetical protein